MKKLVSLLVALLMLFSMTTSFAEETLVYSFTLEAYQELFNQLTVSNLGVTAAWSTAEDGSAVAEVTGYPSVGVYTVGQNVSGLSFTVVSPVTGVSDVANAFGQMMSLSALSALVLEDPTFLETGLNTFIAEITPLITNVSAKAESVPKGELYSETRIVFGSAFTMSMGYADAEGSSVVMAFSMAPTNEEPAEPAEEEPFTLAETFTFDVAVYQNMLDAILAEGGLAITWTQLAEGYYGEIAGYPAIVLLANAAGQITSVYVEAEFDLTNADGAANAFGQALSYAAMPALMLEDASFANNIGTFLSKMTTLITEVAGALDTITVGESYESYAVITKGCMVMSATLTSETTAYMSFCLLPVE